MKAYATNINLPTINILSTDTGWKYYYITLTRPAELSGNLVNSVRFTGTLNKTGYAYALQSDYFGSNVPASIDTTLTTQLTTTSFRFYLYATGQAATMTFSNVVFEYDYSPAPQLTFTKSSGSVYPSIPVTCEVSSTLVCDAFELRFTDIAESATQGQGGFLPASIAAQYPVDSNGVHTFDTPTDNWSFDVTYDDLIGRDKRYFTVYVWARSGGVWGYVRNQYIYNNFKPTLQLSSNKSTLSEGETATITVTSDAICQKFEARGRYNNNPSRGDYNNLIGDDVTVDSNGVHTFSTNTRTWTFDVGYDELTADAGTHYIGVWAEGVSYTGNSSSEWGYYGAFISITKILPILPVMTVTSPTYDGYESHIIHGEAAVTFTVTSDIPCSAFEAVIHDSSDTPTQGSGTYVSVIDDDYTVDGVGVTTFATPKTTWTFDIDYADYNQNGSRALTIFAKSSDYNTWGTEKHNLRFTPPLPQATVTLSKNPYYEGETITATITMTDQTCSGFSAIIYYTGEEEWIDVAALNGYTTDYDWHTFPTPQTTWQLEIPYQPEMYVGNYWIFEVCVEGTTYSTIKRIRIPFEIKELKPELYLGIHPVQILQPGETTTVYVNSDIPCSQFEARANTSYSANTQGVGIDVIGDEYTVDSNGIHTFATPQTQWSFNVDYEEINANGTYYIKVFAKADGGSWGGIYNRSIDTQPTQPRLKLLFPHNNMGFLQVGETTTITVVADMPCSAFEVRGNTTIPYADITQGTGINIIDGEYTTDVNGVHTFATPRTTWTFNVKSTDIVDNSYHQFGLRVFAKNASYPTWGNVYPILSIHTITPPYVTVQVDKTILRPNQSITLTFTSDKPFSEWYCYVDNDSITDYTGFYHYRELDIMSENYKDMEGYDGTSYTFPTPVTTWQIEISYMEDMFFANNWQIFYEGNDEFGDWAWGDISFDIRPTIPILSVTKDNLYVKPSNPVTVSVTSDLPCRAYEARATTDFNATKGMGKDIIKDDLDVVAGVHTFATPQTSWAFDVEKDELVTDGLYYVFVYAQSTDGEWSEKIT